MRTGHARAHGPRTRTRPRSAGGGGGVVRGTLGWYGDASGGFLLESLDEWNPRLANTAGHRLHVGISFRS